MLKKRVILFFFLQLVLFSFFQQTTSAQTKNELDSLRMLLKSNDIHDTIRANTFNRLAYLLRNTNPSKTEEYAKKALQLSRRQNYKHGIGEAYRMIGLYYKVTSNYNKAMDYYLRALSVFERGNEKFGLAETINNIGNIYKYQKNYDLALDYFMRSLEIKLEINNKRGIGIAYNNIGIILYMKGNYNQALSYYNKARKIFIELDNLYRIARVSYYIGEVYLKLKNHELAKNNFYNALEIRKKIGDKNGMVTSYNSIAIILTKQKQYNKADSLFSVALQLAREIDAKHLIVDNYYFTSQLHEARGNDSLALIWYKKYNALKDSVFNKEKSKQISELEAKYHSVQKDAEIALLNRKRKVQRNYFIAIIGFVLIIVVIVFRNNRQKHKTNLILHNKNKEINQQKEEILQANEKFRIIFERTTDAHILYKQTIIDCNDATLDMLEYEDKNELTIKSLFDISYNEDKDEDKLKSKIEKLINDAYSEGHYKTEWTLKRNGDKHFPVEMTLSPAEYQDEEVLLIVCHDLTERKKSENELKKAHKEVMIANQEIIITNIQLEQQKEELSARKNEIEIKSKHITDSINYASRIQSAILQNDALLNEQFFENFVFYKPKDIVSGDFYWSRHIDNYLIIAVADCTGHGVPGAFMSMLGVSFLNEIISGENLRKPSEILNELRKKIKLSLRQTGKELESKDGMDIALCVIDLQTHQLQYSGAFSPLYIIHNTESNITFEQRLIETKMLDAKNRNFIMENNDTGGELLRIKADKMPIGVYHREKDTFTNHIVQLFENDLLYMFSDGFVDQFGGDRGRKFMTKQFKELLLDIYNKPLDVQKQILEDTYENWKGKHAQVDDILVMGVKATFKKLKTHSNVQNIWNDKLILVVEDRESTFMIIEETLYETRVNLKWVENGEEAVKMVQEKDFDLIIMDINMPVMNGFDAIAQIRKISKDIPIIVQTTYSSDQDRKTAYRLGCNDYITKPINENELISAIARYFNNN